MKHIRFMNRYRITITILLVTLLAGSNAQATGVKVKGNVYGGGNAADVGVNATVNISAGQIGDAQVDDEHGNVFGGGKGQVTTVVGDVMVNIGKKVTIENEQSTVTYSNNDKVTILGSVYGGSALGAVNATKANNWDAEHLDRISATFGKTTQVNICAGTINGNTYGGGRGQIGENAIEAKSFGAVTVNIGVATSSAATTSPVVEGSVYGGSNLNGFLESSVSVNVISGTIGKEETTTGENPTTTITGGYVHGGGFGQPTLVKGNVTVNIGVETNSSVHYGYATIRSDVYGGSAMGNVNATKNGNGILEASNNSATSVNLYGGTINGDLYGGGLGDNTPGALIEANVYGPVTVTTKGGTVQNVYGCNNFNGSPQQSTEVYIVGGTINEDVYGGGNLANSVGIIAVTIDGGTVTHDVYGGGALANTNTRDYLTTTDPVTNKSIYPTTVTLSGGSVRDVYGGGLGSTGQNGVAALVYGDIYVELNGTTVTGNIYGCNNNNGTPKKSVIVEILRTIPITDKTYDLTAVYGGGNLATYDPDFGTQENPLNPFTQVIVWGCNDTKIESVYGGGKAAAVPATYVTINAANLIDAVYGGGHGTYNGSAANVGYKNDGTTSYGTGTAQVFIKGGTINSVYGGSNANGNIRVSATTQVDTENNTCDFHIAQLYSGGNMAPMTGLASLDLKCVPAKSGNTYAIDEVYGGANQANFTGDIELNINGGSYGKIFGGNNNSGTISGNITVNVEEKSDCDCKAIQIGQLFGGGNLAAYTTNGNYPEINIYSCTSIDDVFGGGNEANVSGNPIVNIRHGTHTYLDNASCNIGNVYGGGSKASVTGNPSINIGTTGSTKTLTITGNVYGGGMGVLDTSGENDPDNGAQADITGTPTVTLYQGTVQGGLYGGGHVRGSISNGTSVYLYGGQVGTAYTSTPSTIPNKVFGGGLGAETAVSGTINTYIGTEQTPGTTVIYGNVYGGSEEGSVAATNVYLYGGTIYGNAFGGGYQTASGKTAATNINVTLKGTIFDQTYNTAGNTLTAQVFGCNNIAGSPTGTVSVEVYSTGGSNNSLAAVYGGGNEASYTGTPSVQINGGIISNVFGGGLGSTAPVGGTNVNMSAGTVNTIYGGGSLASVTGNSRVSITGGTLLGTDLSSVIGSTVRGAVFGGGYGNLTNVGGNVEVSIGSSSNDSNTNSPSITGDVYGGSAMGTVNTNTNNKTEVKLLSGTITGDVYGGGLGSVTNSFAANVNGNVFVYQGINDNDNSGALLIAAYDSDNIPSKGRIFGCNNVNGTPLGHVKVVVYSTVGNETTQKKSTDRSKDAQHTYELAAVYGGGNHAEYVPTSMNGNDNTEVIIDGCNNVSIHSVYGGGNAAATPATNVTITGAYEIEFVFGGGNGAGTDNPGANVGYHYYDETLYGGTSEQDIQTRLNASVNGTPLAYGTGVASTNIHGGRIHNIYGGSNTKGNIREVSVSMIEEVGTCELEIDGIYGGGKSAYMEGNTKLSIGCVEQKLDAIYGGSENADLGHDIELTITSGKYGSVFGGNNKGGRIFGSITVNIEQTGCIPIEIDQLYAGGDNAPYSIYGYGSKDETVTSGTQYILNTTTTGTPYDSPKLNIRSFKTIGSVYGGGRGELAKVVGNPEISVNVTQGWIDGEHSGTEPGIIKQPNEEIDYGKIDYIYGGGNLAEVDGSTTINIGDQLGQEIELKSIKNLIEEITETGEDISLNNGVYIGIHKDENDTPDGVEYYIYQGEEKVVKLVGYKKQTVYRATVNHDVYGGGNQALLTGGTKIQVGPEPTNSTQQQQEQNNNSENSGGGNNGQPSPSQPQNTQPQNANGNTNAATESNQSRTVTPNRR